MESFNSSFIPGSVCKNHFDRHAHAVVRDKSQINSVSDQISAVKMSTMLLHPSRHHRKHRERTHSLLMMFKLCY